ncbi:hypothetical protein MKX03_014157, partial [Papaver bracteatum]
MFNILISDVSKFPSSIHSGDTASTRADDIEPANGSVSTHLQSSEEVLSRVDDRSGRFHPTVDIAEILSRWLYNVFISSLSICDESKLSSSLYVLSVHSGDTASTHEDDREPVNGSVSTHIQSSEEVLSRVDDRSGRVHPTVDIAEILKCWTHALQHIHHQPIHLVSMKFSVQVPCIEDLIAHREHRYRISESSSLAAMDQSCQVPYPDVLSIHSGDTASRQADDREPVNGSVSTHIQSVSPSGQGKRWE